ncbi:MAG TPA: hypothetical protein VK119_06210 [Bacillota bacterium]|nr:hypothetical protein [Bacillota bacterium]
MTIEMEDFLYELKNYAQQTHIFKDAFERLTPEEQDKVSALDPYDQPMPPQQHRQTFGWLEQMQNELSAANKS